jgi:hypothetical protein
MKKKMMSNEHDRGRKMSIGGWDCLAGRAQLIKNVEASDHIRSDHALAARSTNQRSRVVIWEQVPR